MSVETDESDEEVRIMPRLQIARVPSHDARQGLNDREPAENGPVHEVSDDSLSETVSDAQVRPVGPSLKGDGRRSGSLAT